MLDDRFLSGRAGGSGDGRAVSGRGRRNYYAMLMHPKTVVGVDGTVWNDGREYRVDETGMLVQVMEPDA